MVQPLDHQPSAAALPFADRVRRVDALAPLAWLRAGWADLRRAPRVGLAYGAVYVVIGYALTVGLALADALYLLTPLTAGFLLVGPALAVGLYESSRCLERGTAPTLAGAFLAWRANTFHVLTTGLVLMLYMMIWVRIAALIFALFFPYTNMSLAALGGALTTPDGLLFLVVGTVIGAAFAVVAFLFTVVALPLMIEHRTDIFTGALVSALAVSTNPRPMILWAALIAAIGFAGLFSGFLGLVVAMPLLGHATWHAYRALVTWPPAAGEADTRPHPGP